MKRKERPTTTECPQDCKVMNSSYVTDRNSSPKRRKIETVKVQYNCVWRENIKDGGAGGSTREAVPENEQVVVNNNDNKIVQVSTNNSAMNNCALLNRPSDNLFMPLCIGRQYGQHENVVSNLTPGALPQPIPNQSMKYHKRRENSFKFLRTKYNLLQSEIEKQLLLNGYVDNHCTEDYVDKIDKLLAKVNVKNVHSLPELIEEKQRDSIHFMGFPINFPNPNEIQPSLLHDMIMEGNIEKVRELVAQGANVHARDTKGLTSLHLCILSGSDKYLDMVKILLAHGADINSTCNLDKPVFLLAAEKGKGREDLQKLVKLGANFKTTDGAGDTILHYVSRQGDVESIKYFIHLGASVNAVNKFNNKPLHAASIYCKQNFIPTVDLLVMYDADVNALGADERAAYWFAVRVKEPNESMHLWNLVEKPRTREKFRVATP